MRRTHWLLAAALTSLGPRPALAQINPSFVPPARPDQNPRSIRERQRPGPRTPRARARNTRVTPFVLRQVVIEGSTLPASELEAAWRPFVGETLDTRGLLKVTDALAQVFERDDIAIYTVTIENQAFTDGVLRIRALEGHIESVDVQGPAGVRSRALVDAYVRKLTAQQPLRRSTLQRYVSLIRDISGLDSEMNLENGSSSTGVRMTLKLKPHPVQVALALNNRGTAFLGRTQIQGDLILNSLLRQGDQIRLTAAFPTDFNRFQFYATQLAEPLGADGAVLTANASYLRTRPKDTTILGQTVSAGVQVSYPLLRSYDRKAYFTLDLDGANNRNAFLGFTFANDQIRALRLAFSYTRQNARLLYDFSATYSQGLDALGAHTLTPGAETLDFHKWNVKGGLSLGLGNHGALRLHAAGQWSGEPLPPTEQFALGGEEFGRGYEASTLAGDDAVAASAELAYAFPKVPVAFSGSEAYAFADVGEVWYKSRFGQPTAAAGLASLGFGVRATIAQKAVVQLEAADPLENPTPLLGRRGWRGIVSIRTLF
jgi:hemolysin activation/secretion protein